MVASPEPRENPSDAAPWSAVDLRWVVRTALERGAHLLAAGELHVAHRLLDLPDAPLGVYARLSARRHAFQRAEDLDGHEADLVSAGLVGTLVPWSVRAAHSTVAELKAGAKALGLRCGGRREALVERLAPHTGWSAQRWIEVRHRGLLRRLERFAFLRAHPDRSALVVERLGHVRWPEYTPTRGTALFATRAALCAWEACVRASDPETLLGALEAGHTGGPGRLDVSRRAIRAVLDAARELERAGDPERAGTLYAALVRVLGDAHDLDTASGYATRAHLRLALTREAAGDPRGALWLLEAHRPLARGADRLALNRTGRRLARQVRRGWAPDRPLTKARERTVPLPLHSTTGPRPRWRDGEVIEHAVAAMLGSHGRVALHVEGGLWRTLLALLFGPSCFFLPVPGQLPVPRLPGPLDLETPAFAARRRDAIDAVRARIRAGEAAAIVSEAYARFEGCRLAGCQWETEAVHRTLAEQIGPELLLAVLDPLLEGGHRAASGLPDLLVLPGPPVRVPGAIPGTVDAGLHLVEIKGPSDTLSDAQRTWLDRLARVTRVEVWRVHATR